MGYCTSYEGKIEITSDKCKRMLMVLTEKDRGDEHGTLSFYSSKFDSASNTLRVDEDAKFYDEEMERIFCLIAKFDKGASGEVLSQGDEDDDKKRFTISNGKVFCEEGYTAYKNKKNITNDYEEDEGDMAEIENDMKKIMARIKCDKCGGTVDLVKFNFSKRGYYERIKEETKFENLDEKCYRALKKTILEMDVLNSKTMELKQTLSKKEAVHD